MLLGTPRLVRKVQLCCQYEYDLQCLPARRTCTFSYLGRTCYTYLRRHYGVGAYFIIVCHLNQIIQFHTAMYDGGSHSSTVHTRVGTDFHMVFQDSDTYLRYFFIALGSGGEAKTVCTDNATGVQDAVVPTRQSW